MEFTTTVWYNESISLISSWSRTFQCSLAVNMFMNWTGAWSKKNAFYSFFFPSFFPSPSLSPLLIGSTVKYNNYPLSRVLPSYTCAIKTHILLHWTGSNFYVVSTISPAFVAVVVVFFFLSLGVLSTLSKHGNSTHLKQLYTQHGSPSNWKSSLQNT